MESVGPGTYRIINVASSTALTVPDGKEWEVVCWHRHNGRNQQWYLQRSGRGYSFKNCQNGLYLTVTDGNQSSLLRMGEFPTSWSVFKGDSDHNMYIIREGYIDRVVDLDGIGAKHDGNQLHTYSQDPWAPQRRWWFERMSDETGDGDNDLRNELTKKNQQIATKDQQLNLKEQHLATKDWQIGAKDQAIAEKDRRLAELVSQLANKDQELARVQDGLSKNTALLEQTQSALRHAEALLNAQEQARDRKIGYLESELLQQQREMASLRERTETLEGLFPQTANRPNNMT